MAGRIRPKRSRSPHRIDSPKYAPSAKSQACWARCGQAKCRSARRRASRYSPRRSCPGPGASGFRRWADRRVRCPAPSPSSFCSVSYTTVARDIPVARYIPVYRFSLSPFQSAIHFLFFVDFTRLFMLFAVSLFDFLKLFFRSLPSSRLVLWYPSDNELSSSDIFRILLRNFSNRRPVFVGLCDGAI